MRFYKARKQLNIFIMKKLLFLLMLVLGTALVCVSCNVTRKVTTEASYFTKGDTTCTIVTKTTEVYDAKKNVTQP